MVQDVVFFFCSGIHTCRPTANAMRETLYASVVRPGFDPDMRQAFGSEREGSTRPGVALKVGVGTLWMRSSVDSERGNSIDERPILPMSVKGELKWRHV